MQHILGDRQERSADVFLGERRREPRGGGLRLQIPMRPLALALLGLAQVARAVAQHALHLAPVGNLREQHPRRVVAAARRGGQAGRFGHHVRVAIADVDEIRRWTGIEPSQRVGAEQLEGVALRQIVPDLLEPERRLTVAPAPQHVDHLAVDADPLAVQVGQHRFDQAANHLPKARVVGGRGTGQLRQQIVRVEDNQVSRPARIFDAAAGLVEASQEEPEVRLGRDQERGFAGEQARAR